MTVTSTTNSLADAITICIAQSREGQCCRYVFRGPDGLFRVRDDAPFDPDYVILAAACNGTVIEVPPT